MRRRAVLSVRANPVCPDEATAERAVNEVWESCFNDTRPFDEVMRQVVHGFRAVADGVITVDLLGGRGPSADGRRPNGVEGMGGLRL